MEGMRFGRTVVTGHQPDGTAVIVSEAKADAVALAGPAVVAHFLYGRDDVPTYPDDGSASAGESPFPPPGGCRVSYLRIAPGANEAYHAFIASALGDLADDKEPGFHRTPTLDIAFVVAGSVTLELDAGNRTDLEPGDVVVQNGTRHRWHNSGDTEAVIATVVLGANAAPAG
ncbi:MAG TPA: cupin domain-containing protein [Acidimicrobiia bacterium]|nr:cupin domain-containing protein [Acidimicrobiia bacterium]